MKLPFVSRKKYELLESNYKVTSNARRDLNRDFVRVQEELKKQEGINRELGISLEKESDDIVELKKELKRLRTLLTKNKIEYKKEK